MGGRDTAIVWAAGIVNRRDVLYLDTETTGLGSEAEIVDIAVIDATGHLLLDTLVRPVGRIPRGATAIHGIDDATVARARTWSDVYAELVRLFQSAADIVVYNAAFDRRIIQQTNRRHGLPPLRASWQCAMLQYAAFVGAPSPAGSGYRWRRLEQAARAVGAGAIVAHRALADTQACRAVVEAMAASEQFVVSRRDGITAG